MAPASNENSNTGRPLSLTPAIDKAICDKLAEGYSLVEICEASNMPGRSTVHSWLYQGNLLVQKAAALEGAEKAALLANPLVTFLDNYVRAREVQADTFMDETVAIADDSRNDWIERFDKRTGERQVVPNVEHIQRSKLRVETRMKVAANLNPKKWGQRVETTIKGDAEAPMTFTLKIDNK